MSDISERPLLRGNVLSLSAVGGYEELLVIESDPTCTLYVGHIRIDINDTTSLPYINVFLDGKQYLKDFLMLSTTITADFGRHIKLSRVSKPIRIEMRKSAAGMGTLIATAAVDGIEMQR